MSDDLATFRVISEIIGPVGAKPRDVENWIRTLDLRTSYRPTIQGSPRYYTRDNVLELAFISAFAKAGIRPGIGVVHAYEHVQMSKSTALPEWTVFRPGIPNSLLHTDDLNSKAVTDFLAASPFAAVVIAFRAFVGRIDRLFAHYATTERSIDSSPTWK
jgi:hypothetical protein